MERTTFHPKLSQRILAACGLAAFGILSCQAAAAQGDAVKRSTERQCNLAIVSKLGPAQGIIYDEKTVRELARQGHVYEQNELGIASVLAITPEYSTEEALNWFEQAAQRGYAPAQVNLAVMYSFGWGTTVNYGKALYWLKMAADQKYPRAYFDLGVLYLQGKGVRQDYAKSAELFRKGAEAGDTSAESNLGYMYDRGLGVAQNLAEAAAWYRKAADQGSAMGENNLADLYLRGEGVPQDDGLAFVLFKKAAAQGHTGAQIKLGYMYAEGRGTTGGTTNDPETAYIWLTAATSAGDLRGRYLAESLERRLTADQIARAKERAQELHSAPKPSISAKLDR
jgi:TPR repeat protein